MNTREKYQTLLSVFGSLAMAYRRNFIAYRCQSSFERKRRRKNFWKSSWGFLCEELSGIGFEDKLKVHLEWKKSARRIAQWKNSSSSN